LNRRPLFILPLSCNAEKAISDKSIPTTSSLASSIAASTLFEFTVLVIRITNLDEEMSAFFSPSLDAREAFNFASKEFGWENPSEVPWQVAHIFSLAGSGLANVDSSKRFIVSFFWSSCVVLEKHAERARDIVPPLQALSLPVGVTESFFDEDLEESERAHAA
jgi:hypothetical protein